MNTTIKVAIGKRLGLLFTFSMLACGSASALTLKEAMAVAVESNPEIGQAVENREAIEFELRQAKGLYLPSIDLEASAGARRLIVSTHRYSMLELADRLVFVGQGRIVADGPKEQVVQALQKSRRIK